MALHVVCRWFGVVLCGLRAMANCQTITFFPVYIMQTGICKVVFDPGVVIRKYKICFKVV